MKLRPWLLPVVGVIPTVILVAQQPAKPPTCEQVYKDIRVFKGVPASDLIPAMEFMAASLKVPCTGCHKPNDYVTETQGKKDGRRMVLLQRDINKNWFNSRLEVTCMSCHNGKEKPSPTPIPANVSVSHETTDVEVEPKTLFDKHLAAVGQVPTSLMLIGTMQAPNDQTHEPESKPLELIQAKDGRFRLVSGPRKFGFDGKQVWYYENVLADEPAAILSRLGRSWRGGGAFGGLTGVSLDGEDTIAKSKALVVRARRASSGSIEDIYFDTKSNLLVRLVNIKRSSLGTVISSIDYSNYKLVGSVRVPMKVVATFATGDKWVMNFTSVKAESKVNDSLFRVGGG